MRSIVAMWAVVIAGCAANTPIVVVNPEPPNHAWWLRAVFQPSGKALRGVPVSRISSSWCAVNELEPSIFPDAADVQATSSGVRSPDAKFSLKTTISGSASTVVVAVYKNCSGETGTALVVLADGATDENVVVLVQPVATPATWATIHEAANQRIELWWCFECDNFITLEWDAKKRMFVAVDEGDA